jgi:hypothetical protein
MEQHGGGLLRFALFPWRFSALLKNENDVRIAST